MSEAEVIGLLICIGAAVWVGIDAGELKSRGAQVAPWAWVIGVLFLFIIIFPLYLILRSGYCREADTNAVRLRDRKVMKRTPQFAGERDESRRRELEDRQREAELRQDRLNAQQLHMAMMARLLPPPSPQQAPIAPLSSDLPPPLPSQEDSPPPLPGEVADKKFYIASDGGKIGPFSLATLVELARAGKITKSTLIWSNGMNTWRPIGEMTDLINEIRLLSTKT